MIYYLRFSDDDKIESLEICSIPSVTINHQNVSVGNFADSLVSRGCRWFIFRVQGIFIPKSGNENNVLIIGNAYDPIMLQNSAIIGHQEFRIREICTRVVCMPITQVRGIVVAFQDESLSKTSIFKLYDK